MKNAMPIGIHRHPSVHRFCTCRDTRRYLISGVHDGFRWECRCDVKKHNRHAWLVWLWSGWSGWSGFGLVVVWLWSDWSGFCLESRLEFLWIPRTYGFLRIPMDSYGFPFGTLLARPCRALGCGAGPRKT